VVAVVELFKVEQQEVEDRVVEVTQVLVVVITLGVQVAQTLVVVAVVLLFKVLKQMVALVDLELLQ
jgi:hypothetical protein